MFYTIYSFSLFTLILLSLGYDIFMNGGNNKGEQGRILPQWLVMFICAFIPYINTLVLLEAIIYQLLYCVLHCYIEYKLGRLNIKDND